MPVIQRFRFAVLALLVVMAAGVVGYVAIEGWSVFDALYMTVITLATIGYGEVNTLSQAGRVFTIVLIMAGLVTGALMGATFVELVLTALLSDMVRKRRMDRQLSHLSGHCIVCGWGRMGQEIGEQFQRKGVPFVVIELSAEKCHRIMEQGMLVVQGDASDDAVLKAAGVERATGLISVAPTDAYNIFITLSARALNKQLYIVARSIFEQDVHKLELAGANRVVSPYVIGARRIAAAVFHPAVCDFLESDVVESEAGWEIEELAVTAAAGFSGKTLREAGIRERCGCTVLAIRSGTTNRFSGNPSPDDRLNDGDTLIVVGTSDQLNRLAALGGAAPRGRRSRGRL
ncbi:MAG: TrkA protein [Armatimonadetes bacterium]|jgi:voltage-gated potassium channel|nr:TrkA protein [Armatimonadota bacterium]